MNRIPLVYILSSGRSGSTLLDMLLGTHPEIWTAGEVHVLPWELRTNLKPCGCGRPVSECDFWASVLDKAPLGETRYPIDYFRESITTGKVLRYRHLPGAIRGRCADSWHEAALEYGAQNRRLLEAIRTIAEERREHEIRWIVDASKDAYRLLWLQSSGLFDIRVIHLVKDPRAFVFSILRYHAQASTRMALRMAGRWLVENWLFARLTTAAFPPEARALIRYEDLATRPDDCLDQLAGLLDLTFAKRMTEDFRRIENHAIAGNPMRWKTAGIQLDQRWRSELPPHLARLAWTVTTPTRIRLGYRSA